MKHACRLPLLLPFALCAIVCSAPSARADVPPASPAASPDSKAATVRLDLQLIRTDVVVPPPPSAVPAPVVPTAPAGKGAPAPPAPIVASGPTDTTVASPTLLTLDGSTASIAVSGGDLGYTISLSPSIGPNGKLLLLWNLRVSGKSLPGATGVSLTGAVRIDTGKSATIAELKLTDPATGHTTSFHLQGIGTTTPAGSDSPTTVPVSPTATAPTP